VAYARYREGAALLASRGSRNAAADALRAAWSTATALGAEPLVRDITVLAGTANPIFTNDTVFQSFTSI
jgi:hypothetical protein